MRASSFASRPIAARAAAEAIQKLQLENARRISALRVIGVAIALSVFVVCGRFLGIEDYQGADRVLALDLLAAAAVYWSVRRSQPAAHASGYAVALLDVPALGLLELSLLARAPNPAELVAFNGATLLVFVLAATLFLASGPMLAALLSAIVCHGALQLHTGGHPSHLASTALVFGLAGAICSYAAHRIRGLVVSAALRGLELERAEVSIAQQRRQLKASEERFRSLLDVAPDGAFIASGGRVVHANRPLAELLEYQSEDLAWTPLEAIVEREDEELVLNPSALSSGASEAREVRLRTRSGAIRHVELVGRPIEVEDAPAWLFMTRDLSERRLLEAQLISADRMASMGFLAAGVAHEINTPLAVVAASLEYLESELVLAGDHPQDLHEPLRDAREAAARANEIVRDLRLFSRAEQARFPVDVRAAIESAVRMASVGLRSRARLERRLGEVPRVQASESRLAQMFLNLLNNAVQAIPEGAAEKHVVTLRTHTDPAGWAVVEVSDTGGGIPAENLAHIFQPFFTTKPRGDGMGLGLAICARTVSELGGRIEVESQPLRGSTFRVLLPPASGAAPLLPLLPPPHGDELRQLRILVIDDDPAICRAICRLLGKEDRTTATESTRDAIERLEGGARFDVIFCDLLVPSLSGADFFRILEERFPDQAARVVFMTGGVLSAGGRAFIEAHPGRLIEKPFALAQIRKAIEQRIAAVGIEPSDEPSLPEPELRVPVQ